MPKMKTPEGRIVSVSNAGVEALQRRGYTLLDGAPRATTPVVSGPSAPDPVEAPAKSATKADWVAYAEAQGIESADELTKPELIDRLS